MALTFDYLKKDIIDTLELIKKNNSNLILGSFCGSVIEFLGQFLRYPSIGIGESKNCFCEFVEEFLSKQNSNYSKYKELLWEDFRNGGAHSVLPKGAVVLTGADEEKEHHLEIMEDPTKNRYYLVISTPIFVDDLKRSILEFIKRAEADPSLTNSYVETIKKHAKDGQDYIRLFILKNGINTDFKDKLEGDIRL